MLGASRENGSAVRAYRAILDPHRTPPQGIAASPVTLGAPVRNRHPARGDIRPTRFRGPCTARSPSPCRVPTAAESATPARDHRTDRARGHALRRTARSHPLQTGPTSTRAATAGPTKLRVAAGRPRRATAPPPRGPTASRPADTRARPDRHRTAPAPEHPRHPSADRAQRSSETGPASRPHAAPQRPVDASTALVAHQPRPQQRHVHTRAPHPPQRGTGRRRVEGREGVEPHGNRTGSLPGFSQRQRPRPVGEASGGLLTCCGAMGI